MATVVDGIARLISTSPKEDADVLRTATGIDRKRLAAQRPTDRSPLRELYLDTRDKVLYFAVVNFFSSVLSATGPDGQEAETESFLTRRLGYKRYLM